MAKRSMVAEMQSPPKAASLHCAITIAMPAECSEEAALILGEGLSRPVRIANGRLKYRQLRQKLLDEHLPAMPSRFPTKDVTYGTSTARS